MLNHTSQPEYTEVEKPLLNQLESMGWTVIEGTGGELHGRSDYREFLLESILREKLYNINRDRNGNPWLDNTRLEEAISTIRNPDTRLSLIEINRALTRTLIKGVTVIGQAGERDQEIAFFDWDNIANNDFLAISQFRVNRIGGVRDSDHIKPDIVLFVNGIPSVVIECKSPYITDPEGEALDQFNRYMNLRSAETAEGAVQLFYPNVFCIGTHYYGARMGAIAAPARFWLEWKDVAPFTKRDVMQELDRDNLDPLQLVLAAGTLRPKHLLDILRNFVLFKTEDGQRIKVVPRYQQYRAVHYSVDRLLNGKTRQQSDQNEDERGGIIWHTQGSGKSLTMVFLVRFMRSRPDLAKFKVVIVTDRTDLQEQLSETMAYTGETVSLVKSRRGLEQKLAVEGSDLIFVMVQKYGLPDGMTLEDIEQMPALNHSEDILVLIDEAHRSHTGTFNAVMRKLLPSAAHIGFTGTPIILGDAKRTATIFGNYIDTYTITESEEDGMTVPLLYELRASKVTISDAKGLDSLFEDMMDGYSLGDKEKIQRQIAHQKVILESAPLIRAKARDILRHYAQTILPNGFKAMLVAVSREAAVRYQSALQDALVELVAELDTVDPNNVPSPDAEDADERFVGIVYPHLETLRRLDFGAVISAGHNDPPEMKQWAEAHVQKDVIARFKKPIQKDGMAFLCVQRMLITGFDAPIAQVLYLDRFSQNHELLQTIARVNRTASGKKCGYIVDYYGIPQELKAALTAYSNAQDYLNTVLHPIRDEINNLEIYHREVLQLFAENGIADIYQTEQCVLRLKDDVQLRARFSARLKRFLSLLDVVLPLPEGLPYVPDAKQLGRINVAASRLLRDSQLNIHDIGGKVRQLIDDYLVVNGIDPKVPPISIMANDFIETVQAHISDEAKAAEMEHAATHHINVHFSEDPAYYRRLSERLNNIIARYAENIENRVQALLSFTEDLQAGRKSDHTGLDKNIQLPFFDILKEEISGETLSSEDESALIQHIISMVDYLQDAVQEVGFWDKPGAQRNLHSWLVRFLDTNDIIAFDKQEMVADRIIETAKARRQSLN
ncbi:MAG: type I restriction endonuclease subunit R [Chloroflexota bacterium]